MAPFEDKSEKSPVQGQDATGPTPTPTDSEKQQDASASIVPAASGPVAVQYRPMPSGGLQRLALDLYPDDADDADKMRSHVGDLLDLNRDSLRDDTTYRANQLVRIA